MRYARPTHAGGRRRRPVRRLAAVGLATFALVAAGCASAAPKPSGPASNGVASKSPAQILAAAQKATISARTVRIVGSGTFNGNAIELDIVAGHGAGGGTVSEGGATLDTVLAAKEIYLKATEASWMTLTHQQAIAKLLANRWVDAPSTTASFSTITNIFDLRQLVSNLHGSGAVTKGKVTNLHGRPVVALVDSAGSILYVATTGKPYIEAIKAGKKSTGAVDFEQYNTATPPAAPSKSTPITRVAG
jgi:hypothetical protein